MIKTPTDFAHERLYAVLASIPNGQLITYGRLAQLIGMPKRSRWVGQILKQLPVDTKLPWHRVINAQGRISLPINTEPYLRQLARLKSEGVIPNTNGKFDLTLYGFLGQ